MKKILIILLLLICTISFSQSLNGRRINKRNKFQKTYMIDQGFEYMTKLEDWRQCRELLNSDGTISCLEVIGDKNSSESVSLIELTLPEASVTLNTDEKKHNVIGKSNTRNAINVGDIELPTRIFTDDKLKKYKQFARFDKLIIQHLKTETLVTDTLTLQVNIPGIPAFPSDGAINEAFWLDTVEGASNVRIVAQLNDNQGDVIYENVSKIAWDNGAGDSLSPGEDSFTLSPGFDSEYPLIEFVTFYFPEPITIRGFDDNGTFVPWQAADGWFYQAEEVFALLNWRDDVEYEIDDYITENGVIYQAMMGGYQTGDFESNVSKWCAVRGYYRIGEMYFDNNTNSVGIVSANTWYQADDTTAGYAAGFIFDNGTLVAGVGSKGVYQVNYAVSAQSASANRTFDFAISLNDSVLNKSISQTKFISQDIESVPGQAVLIALEEGDVIKLETRNLTSGTDITIKYGNIMVEQICE